MDLFDAIQNRQSIGTVKPDAVPREDIEKLLSAAVQAPNHYKVRPWRFVVLTGEGRERLGKVMAESAREQNPGLPEEALSKVEQKERSKPLRAPVLIAIGVDRPSDPKVLEIENVCAAAAACQNLLLAAHGMGLAAKWRTGEPASDPRVKAFLGFAPEQHLIAFLYIGYPESEPEAAQRPSFEDRTVWMD